MAKKAMYSKPASQVDLEARQKSDYQPSTVLGKGVDPQLSENGFVGVDPIYQNFADVTGAPFAAESGPEAKLDSAYVTEDADYKAGAADASEYDNEDEEEEDEEPTDSPNTPASPTPPAGF